MSNPFDLAYAVLKAGESCTWEGDEEYPSEVANRHIAVGLGYTIQGPTNFSYWSMTTDPSASPYRDSGKFREIPKYADDFDSARKVARGGLELSLRQMGDEWVAAYFDAGSVEVSREVAATPGRATAMAALATRLTRVGA